GFFWVALSTIASRLVSFLTTLILARLLTPADFGLVALALLAINSLQFFQELGFGAALIYRQEDVEEASYTAFFSIVCMSLLLYTLSALGAPLVARFFDSPGLTSVLRVLALIMVIGSFGQVPYVLLSKELDFRRRAAPDVLSGFGGSVLAIGLALSGFGVWSLVYGQILESALRTVLVWRFCPWRPRRSFSWSIARDLFGYGKHIVGSRVLIFFITNIDDAFVGKLAGSTALGLYGLAYKISNLPATQITRLINQVMFPAFSRMQNRVDEMRRTYFTAVRTVAWLSAPIAVATVVFAPNFVIGLYGDTWAPAVLPMQLLAVYGFIRSIAANMGNIFRAGGRPQWLVYIAAWRLATMALLLYPATHYYGIVGVSALSAGVAVVDFIISAWLVDKLLDASILEYVRILAPALGCGAVAAGAGRLVLGVSWGRPLWGLLAAGIVMGIVYLPLIWLADGELRRWVSMARHYIPRWRDHAVEGIK
ncbi:MAG: lipopolysaccharide biosynthesis protein, partial [Anaerolineae bacterium]|nr:lipopolysaccharide biosynthesis protein [Anaerolineae bacterium]